MRRIDCEIRRKGRILMMKKKDLRGTIEWNRISSRKRNPFAFIIEEKRGGGQRKVLFNTSVLVSPFTCRI